jgi:hypothetical protein
MVTGSGSQSRTDGKVPQVRDSKSQANVAKHTGRPKSRLASCAARLSTAIPNLIAFSPAAYYRSEAGKHKAYGRRPSNRPASSGRLAGSGTLAWFLSGVDGELATAYAHLIHGDVTGSPPAVVLGAETPCASDRPSGTRRIDAVRALPSSPVDPRIARESPHVGLMPSVLTESCPSLGRSKGGAVPPETNGHPLQGENHGRGKSNWQFESGGSC